MLSLRTTQRWFAVALLAVSLTALPQSASAGGRTHHGGHAQGFVLGAAVGAAIGTIFGFGQQHYRPAPRHYSHSYSPRPVYRNYGHGGYGRTYYGHPRSINRHYYGHPKRIRRHYGYGHGYRRHGH